MISETQLQVLNSVANEPEVRAQVAPGYLSVHMDNFAKEAKNCVYGNEHGVLLMQYHGDGRYEGHYLFTATASPREVMRTCRRAIADLFTNHGASVINGTTPRGNLPARLVNRALGLVPCGETTDTAGRACIKYKLERDKWVP